MNNGERGRQRLPNSIVKQTQSVSVRELSQKIENHPNRHALQRDLRQSQSFNPFSPESKQMIHEVGNIELCELLETEPKTQCKVCLSYYQLHDGPSFNFGVRDQERRPHGRRYGKKPGDREYSTVNQLKKKCKKKFFQGASMIDSHEMKHSVIE